MTFLPMRPLFRPLAALAVAAFCSPVDTVAWGQDPLRTYSDAFEIRFSRSQPVVRYVIEANPKQDSLGYSVTMIIRNVSDTVRLASPMWAPGAYRVANFHRHIHNLRVIKDGVTVPVVREDSLTWRFVVPRQGVEDESRGEMTIQYEVRYPTAAAAAGLGNYSFFRPDGGLLSGPMTYLYIVGHTLAPAHVTFKLPTGWKMVSGLTPTSDPNTFFAASYDILADCPILIGENLRIWSFEVDGVPHRIAYYPTTPKITFDSVRWVDMHRRIVMAGRDAMGRLPYREYTFIYEDGPGGGLEHLNSSTMAGPASVLAANIYAMASLTSHEFFHAWNIKRLRPINLGPFTYNKESRSKSLWWAEGVTDFYGDYLLRRAGIWNEEQAKKSFANSIQSYLNNPGRDKVSPERASWTTWDPNTVNNGYNVSYYTTGGLLGEMFELYLRHRTNGARGMDDVARYMFDRYAGPKGYTDEDILKAFNAVCGCNMKDVFKRYISGTTPFDFAPYLAYAGWKLTIDTVRVDREGRPLPDLRAGITGFNGVGSLGSYVGSPARLSLNIPDGSFGKAGLVDGDFITAVNGKPITDPMSFRAAFEGAKVGDSFKVDYVRAGKGASTTVVIQPYEVIIVRIEDLPVVTPEQRKIRELWMRGPRL
jgi:predicted metalloprotease with PDZ domain